jgi:hypothetical protein
MKAALNKVEGEGIIKMVGVADLDKEEMEAKDLILVEVMCRILMMRCTRVYCKIFLEIYFEGIELDLEGKTTHMLMAQILKGTKEFYRIS